MRATSALLAALVVATLLGGAVAPVTAATAQGGAHGASQAGVSDATVAQASDANAANESGEESPKDNEVIADVDDSMSIVSYEYQRDNETMIVELRNDGGEDRDVTITEIVSSEDARGTKTSLTFGIAIVEVEEGETLTARVDVRDRGDMAGVTVTTQESAQAGSGEALLVDLDDAGGGGLIQGPATAAQVRAGALAGGGSAMILMFLGAWQFIATKNEAVKDADLSPSLSLLGRFRDE